MEQSYQKECSLLNLQDVGYIQKRKLCNELLPNAVYNTIESNPPGAPSFPGEPSIP